MMEADVAIVGYGPTGMTLSALLGQRGHRVVVLERYEGLYNLPRAAAFDDETMRTFQKLGVAERVLPGTNVQHGYVWVNGEGEVLLDIEYENPGRNGWPTQYMMYQPHLESVLDAAVRARPNVEVRQGTTVTAIIDRGDGVHLRTTRADGAEGSVSARFAIGCDGGNSLVRSVVGSDLADYGFSENWLVCDFQLRTELPDLPSFMQVCNPIAPIAIVNIGPARHRFSFRLESYERRENAMRPESVWRRISHYLDPVDADLVRVANYTFRSCVATTWRRGNLLLAGDAAHQMPPFLAQGMVSGIRDARNLAWKLDMVLAGHSPHLLDSYQLEREPHVRFIIEKAVELGGIQTMRDPEQAQARDHAMIAARRANQAPDRLHYPPLARGVIANHGALFPQGLVSDNEKTALFDEIAGTGWLLVTSNPRVAGEVPAHELAVLSDLQARRVSFALDSAFGGADLSDTGGVYTRWFTEHSAVAAIVRPDSYVFGLARDARELTSLLRELRAALARPPRQPAAAVAAAEHTS